MLTECLPHNFVLWKCILRQPKLDQLVLSLREAVAKVNQFLKVLGKDWLRYLKTWMQFSRVTLWIEFMNCFCGMVDQQKTFSLISSRVHCQRSTSLQISDMLWAGFEHAQNLSSGLVEWSYSVVITTTPQHQDIKNFQRHVCAFFSKMYKSQGFLL